jgi:DHA1 family tetracycline resistance protein-like MFS transporter
MGSAFSFGFLVGPALGGLLAEYSLRLPFMVAAGLTLANWLYGFFILPESLSRERRIVRFEWRRANPLGSLALLRSHRELTGLASVGFLYQVAHQVLPNIFVLYVGFRYNWTPATMGFTMAATGVAGVLVQSLLVGPVVARIGERGALLLGCMAGTVGFIWYGYAPNGWIYLAAVPVFALMNFVQPGLQGLMTRRVAPHEQGQLQGANQALAGVAAMVGPPIFGLSFAWAIHHDATLHMPGLPVYIAGALMLMALALATRVGRAPAQAPQPAS